MSQITIVWLIDSKFDEKPLNQLMHKYNAKTKSITNQYEKKIWDVSGINVKQFEKKIMVQGRNTDEGRILVAHINKILGLSLDDRNAKKLAELFPRFQNAIFCPECNSPFLSISGKIHELDFIFNSECGHQCNMKPPFLMLNSRIFPDLNILISKSLSRCINLGYFIDFEVVIPDLILSIIDKILGEKKKKAASDEINNLRIMEKQKKITIFKYKHGEYIVLPKDELTEKEDDLILDNVCLTNAILVTGDRLFRDKALLEKRPTIYINPDHWSKLKHIEDIRIG